MRELEPLHVESSEANSLKTTWAVKPISRVVAGTQRTCMRLFRAVSDPEPNWIPLCYVAFAGYVIRGLLTIHRGDTDMDSCSAVGSTTDSMTRASYEGRCRAISHPVSATSAQRTT